MLDSCGVKFQNDFYVFGGFTKNRQISKVDGCSLKRVGDLNFDFYHSGCTATESGVYLCFSYFGLKQCWFSGHILAAFDQLQDSNFEHLYTRISSSEGSAFILSGQELSI